MFGSAGEPLSAVDIDAIAEQTRFVVSDHYSHWTRWNVEAEAHRQTAHLRVATGAREAVVGAVTEFARSGRRVQLALAPAGAGKTTAMDDYRYTVHALIAELDAQRQAANAGSALPWLACPDYATLRSDPQLAQYLTELGAAITSRVGELRAQVASEQPTWNARLGPRPERPAAAGRWDELSGLAAAYRETYNVTDSDPTAPLGPQPNSAGIKTRAWKAITNQWRPPVTTLDSDDDLRNRNQQRIDALRDQVIQRREDFREDTADQCVHDGDQAAEDHRYNDDEQLDKDTDFHSGLGY